jgi:two-component system, NarL family, response regulator NreC
LEREKFQVLAEASDGQDAVRLTEKHHPDITILDVSMPTLNGIDAARELGHSCPKTKTILLTQHEEEQYIHEALEAGVKGYVLKSQVASDLIHAIQLVARGEFYLSPGISRGLVEAYRSKSERPKNPLTVRERQVLQLIAEGKSTKDTASLLGISAKTAESHRMRLMRKLYIHETASLVRYAVRRGLVQPWMEVLRALVWSCFLNVRISPFDASEMILALSTGPLAELPQLLPSFDIAVFRCRPQQDQRLLAVFWDAVALQIKLRKWNLHRIITRP